MLAFIRFFLLLLLVSTRLCADDLSTNAYTLDDDKKPVLNVQLFLSSTCPHCHKEEAFFKALEPTSPWLNVQRYYINEDKQALIRFYGLLNDQSADDFGVPSAFFCNARWIGYASDDTTGKDILHALTYCRDQIQSRGSLTPDTVSTVKRWANANMLSSAFNQTPTTLYNIIALAMVDAYNPCSLFCIMAFFALLFLQEGRKAQLMIGSGFIITIGVVHYFQQVYPGAFFELLPWLRLPALLIGLFLAYCVNQIYKKSPVTAMFLPVTVLLAFIIQSYQQSCLMNWSYIFEKWVHNQQFTPFEIAFYEICYQILYVLSLIVTLIIYAIFIDMDRFASFRERSKLLGWIILAVIAVLLVVYPLSLTNFIMSAIALAVVYVIRFVILRRRKQLQKEEEQNG